ncbi:MAG TPA: hypothetical protein VD995_30945 [Azospirillum sp.]|nr:hypothetical protein [Azospirillum sp.]
MRPSDHTTLPRRPATSREAPPAVPPDAAPANLSEAAPIHAGPRPEPVVERMRGPGLVLLWGALIAGSWALVLGLGYGAWSLIAAW